MRRRLNSKPRGGHCAGCRPSAYCSTELGYPKNTVRGYAAISKAAVVVGQRINVMGKRVLTKK
jgi:hypothetical protein